MTHPRPCITCGILATASYCAEHQPQRTPARERGYRHGWSALSAKARARQPFCGRCGSNYRIQLHHNESAWHRVRSGHRLTMRDVEVGHLEILCAACNVAAGPARITSKLAKPPVLTSPS